MGLCCGPSMGYGGQSLPPLEVGQEVVTNSKVGNLAAPVPGTVRSVDGSSLMVWLPELGRELSFERHEVRPRLVETQPLLVRPYDLRF